MQKILKLFQKIEVTESTKQAKPGSIGYIKYITDMGAYNAIEVGLVFVRFGKSGKKRLSPSMVRIPLVDIDGLQISENNKIELEALSNREMLPRGHKSRIYDSKIEVIQESSKDLTNIDTWDFMAYISAISLFLSGYRNRYGRAANNGGRAADTSIDEISVFDIGSLMCNMFRLGNIRYRIEELVTYFDNINNKRTWLESLRREISVYRQTIVMNNTSISDRYKSIYGLIRQIARSNGMVVKKLSNDLIV